MRTGNQRRRQDYSRGRENRMPTEKGSEPNLREVINYIRSDIKGIMSNKKFSKMSRRNIGYNVALLDSAENPKTSRKSATENVLMVLKILLEMSEVKPESKKYYRKVSEFLNNRLRELNSDPEISRIQAALQEGTEMDRQMASEALLEVSRSWKTGASNLVPVAFSRLNTENSVEKKNIAGFFYFVSSNNPSLINKHGLDLTSLASDIDPSVRAVALLICLKTKDQRILEKAYEMLQDNSVADLSYLNIPPQTLHFEHDNLKATLSVIANEVVKVVGNESTSSVNNLTKSFTVTLPTAAKMNLPIDVVITANPIMDLSGVELDLSQLSMYFSVPSAKVSVGFLKAHETREFPVRVIPTGNGWVQSKVIITNGRLSQDFPLETYIEVPYDFDEERAAGETPQAKPRPPPEPEGVKKKAPPKISQGMELPEQLLENYSSPEFLGSGGFASVFRVVRNSDEKTIALKIPRISDNLTGESFIREVSAWIELKHPNIVELYRSNVFPMAYIEMEYMPAGGLDKIELPLNRNQVIDFGLQILSGLQFAHSKSRTHSDLKPSNILLDDSGHVKIADWGLSRIGASTGISSTFAGAFTPAYAAPEEISPREFGNIDRRTDLYQVGTILYELATGSPPFAETSFYELTNMILREKAPGFPESAAENTALEDLILKALEKDKNKRFQTAEDFMSALKEVRSAAPPPKKEAAPDPSVTTSMTKTKYRSMKDKLCGRNIELLERDIETRNGVKIVNSLRAIQSCVARDPALSNQILEVIDNLEALAMFSSSVDDARYSLLKDLASAARNLVNSA